MVEQQIYDPTAAQYDQTTLSELYEKGKPTPYYGWGQRPATRFLDLLEQTNLSTSRCHGDHSKEGTTRIETSLSFS